MSQLDLESETFNPELALSRDDVALPVPNVRALSNLAEYESVVTGKRSKGPKPTFPLRPKLDIPTVSRPHRAVKNVLTMMDNAEGPLGRLHKCVKDRVMVKVWTRRAKEMRGVCKGYVEAFDHHWNLVMTDVDETCLIPTVMKTLPQVTSQLDRLSLDAQSQPGVSSSAVPNAQTLAQHRKGKRKVVLHQRHARQLFVRGDNVAFISISDN